MRTAEFEVVDYNTDEMGHASGQLIYDLATFSRLDWTQRWVDVLGAIHDVLKKKKPDQVRWQTPGLTVYFSGLPPALPRVEDKKLVYTAAEPHFILEENVEDEIRPRMRTHLERVTDAIAREMQEVYKMRLSGDMSFRQLTFPKDVYARSIERFQVPVLP